MNAWQEALAWEQDWWGDCVNTYGEETKQFLYAEKMGLVRVPDLKTPYRFDLQGASVLDIGGGPASLLLKCVNVRGKVVDPLEMPDWVLARYALAGIEFEQGRGEDLDESGRDEVWLYNVLQHVGNPELIIHRARQAASLIRIFEWIDTPVTAGHPCTLSESRLNEWLKGGGKTEQLQGQNTCWGQCYYGVFPTGQVHIKTQSK